MLALAATLPGVAAADSSPKDQPQLNQPNAARPDLTGSPFLRVWSPEDYRASPVNWRVVQHPRTEFIYVSNNLGVLEFDGARWRLMPMPRGSAARALVIDAQDRLWAGGIDEIARFDPDEHGLLQPVDFTDRVIAGAARPANAAPDNAEGDTPRGAGSLPLRNLGNLNRAAAGPGGVFFRLPSTIAHFGPDDAVHLRPAAGRFGQLFWFDGALHAEHLEEGLMRLDDHGALHHVAGATSLRAFAIAPASSKENEETAPHFLALTPRGPQPWPGPGHPPAPIPAETAALFAKEAPTCAIFLRDGRIAYGTTRSGALIFAPDGRFERAIDRTHGLPANRVNGLAEDREGGLWLAQHTGIVRVQLDSPFAVHGLAQGLDGGPRQVVRAGDDLYITHGEGLARRADHDGVFKTVAGFRTGTHRALVWHKHVLVTARGLYDIDSSGEVAILPGPYLYDIAALRREPHLVFASSALALQFFRFDDGGWQPAGQLETLPAGIDDMLETDDGMLWVVTRTGEVWRVDFRAGVTPHAHAQRYGEDRGVPAALRRDGIRLLRLGSDVVVSSARWLLRHDSTADRFTPETRFPKLRVAEAGQGATMAAPAPDGGAWFYYEAPTPRLARLRPDGKGGWAESVIAAPQLRDLVANHLFHDAALDTLWIAGQGSLVSVALDWAAAEPRPPLRAVIRRVIGPHGGTIGGPAAAAALRLTAQQTAFRFDIAAPAFDSDHRGNADIAYRTRLDGVDDEWTPWTTEAHRDFTNVPPGTRRFRVQARDFAGRVSEEATLAIALAAPWWRTPWAWAGYAALGICGIVGIVRLRTRALHRRAERLEAIVVERTRELAAQNTELTRLHQLELDSNITLRLAEEKARLEVLRYQLNPHFLYNALNSIYGLVFPHSRPAGEVVRRLADFCRMTLTRDDAGAARTVGEECAALRGYLELEKARWGRRLDFAIDVSPEVSGVPLPPFLLLPLVENAVKYGAASCPELLRIRVSARAEDASMLRIEVANTGTWIEPGGRGTTSTGIGLDNLRQRLARYYPAAHEFDVSPEGEWVIARLRLAITGDGRWKMQEGKRAAR